MSRTSGRGQRAPMERLVRIAAVLKVADKAGVSAEKLVRVAGFTGEHADDQLERDLRYLRGQGWRIDTTSAAGAPARYRMVTVDNRLRVRLTPAQQRALQRAVLLADRADLVERLGLPRGEQPPEVATLQLSAPDEGLSIVLRAVRHRSRLHFRYGGRERSVSPESVRSTRGRWYLRGLEDDGDLVKTFVVSRMTEVSLDAPETARPVPAEPQPGLHPMAWGVDPPTTVVLRTSTAFRPDVERLLGPPSYATERPDGDVDLGFEVTHRAALRDRLYELGRRVQLVGPLDVRGELLAELAAHARQESEGER